MTSFLEESHLLKFQLVRKSPGRSGQTIKMPNIEVQLDGVRPKIRHGDVSAIKDGDVVLVEWEPSAEFRCSFRYLKD